MTKMHVDLRRGEVLTIGTTTVRLEKKSGQVARLVIEADESTPIKTKTARMSASRDTEQTHGEHTL